jgi:rubrerythrin
MKSVPRKKTRSKQDDPAALDSRMTLPLPLPAAMDDFGLTWECPNCGQNFFGEQPPDLCAYCRDFTTWRRRG